jgi:hypothetical protein
MVAQMLRRRFSLALLLLALPWSARAQEEKMSAMPYISVGPFFVLLYDAPSRSNKFLNLQLGFRTDTAANADAIGVARSRIQAGLNQKFKQLDPRDLRGANGAFLVQDSVKEILKHDMPTVVVHEVLIEKMLVH